MATTKKKNDKKNPDEIHASKPAIALLRSCFAATSVLLMKTQSYHWNVVDGNFYALHLLFEKQYEALQEANDLLAERMRQLGYLTPISLAEILQLSPLPEDEKLTESGQEKIKSLLGGHATCARVCKEAISHFEKDKDYATADILTQRLRDHEKEMWFLKSHL